MTTEQTAQNNGLSEEEQAQQAEQAAFLAEMGDGTATKVDEKSPSEQQQPETKQEEQSAQAQGTDEQGSQAQKERKEIFDGMTAEELKAKLDQVDKIQKALDTMNGTYGNSLQTLRGSVEELSKQRQNSIGALTPERLKRLSQEYPELAELLASDLSEIVGQGGAAQVDTAQLEQLSADIQKKADERISQAERNIEMRALTRQHKDWREVAGYDVVKNADGVVTHVVFKNPQFGKFVAGLAPEEQEKIIDAVDADYIADKLTQFKEAQKKAAQQSGKQQDGNKKPKASIEDAVLPSGTGGGGKSYKTPEEEEEAAYRAEMAKA